MAYRAIYRKWRPLTFEDVVGQAHITDTLKTELITDKVAHAYLFCGTRGTGKTSTAKILSRAVNCESLTQSGNPCNACPSCLGILNGTVMDVIEIDAASNNGVDNIRELRDEIVYTPANVKYKVYIIDEVHMLSGGAFNALLKTLEEPPSHAIFILATTEPHKIPATIQSRCQRFDFRRISSRHIVGRIGEITRKDGIAITQDAIALVAALGDGSMRDALSILDLCSGIGGEITKADIENVAGVASGDLLFELADALIGGDVASAVSGCDKAVSAGQDVGSLAESLLGFVRELLICKVSPAAATEILDKSEETVARLKTLAGKVSEETLIHAAYALSDAVSVCKWAANPRVILETALIKICKPETDSASSAFAARLKQLEAAVTLGVPVAKAPPVKQKQPAAKPAEEAPLPDEAPPSDADDVPAVEAPAADEMPTTDGNDDWQAAVHAIKTVDPGAAALLTDTKSLKHGDAFYVIFQNDAIRDMVKSNQGIKDLLKKTAGGRTIKLVTRAELDAKDTVQADPFDELIAKKDELGDQMTLF